MYQYQSVFLALVELVDPENVSGRQAFPLADFNRVVRDGYYSFLSRLPKGSSTGLNSCNEKMNHSEVGSRLHVFDLEYLWLALPSILHHRAVVIACAKIICVHLFEVPHII